MKKSKYNNIDMITKVRNYYLDLEKKKSKLKFIINLLAEEYDELQVELNKAISYRLDLNIKRNENNKTINSFLDELENPWSNGNYINRQLDKFEIYNEKINKLYEKAIQEENNIQEELNKTENEYNRIEHKYNEIKNIIDNKFNNN
tara:strand:+ start:32 stop:469 length:438 start_codon:yes stop_codon:yes gene_type:complete